MRNRPQPVETPTMLYFYFFILLATVAHSRVHRYEGWSVITAHPETANQLQYLTSVEANQADDESELQIWRQGSVKRPYDILLSPQAKPSFLANLKRLRIKYDVAKENIQPAIDAEQMATRSLAVGKNAEWFTRFLTIEEINNFIDQLAKEHRDIVHVEKIGTTHEGRPIHVVKVSSGVRRNKPGIWIDAGIHAREWISTSTALYMLNKLVTGYNTDRSLRNYVDGATWYFAPVLNPDGYAYTRKVRLWRKNRSPRACGSRRCCVGVDLNRNFGFDFGGVGVSGNSCGDTYLGSSAFSEPESRAVRDFVFSHKDITAFITLHSYSQMWFYPFGHQAHSYPIDKNELRSLAVQGAQKLASVRQTKYDVGTAADLLYPSSGGSDDWAKGVAGIKYVYTLELVPSGDSQGIGFILPTREIVPTGEETWAGLSVVADAAMTRSRLR